MRGLHFARRILPRSSEVARLPLERVVLCPALGRFRWRQLRVEHALLSLRLAIDEQLNGGQVRVHVNWRHLARPASDAVGQAAIVGAAVWRCGLEAFARRDPLLAEIPATIAAVNSDGRAGAAAPEVHAPSIRALDN